MDIYPDVNGGRDKLEQLFRDNGMEPPWTQNWKDGEVVPRGEGGILDRYDENGHWTGPNSRAR